MPRTIPKPGPPPPTPEEIRDLLVTILTGAAGKDEAHWRRCVGEVEALPILFNPVCNWRVKATGSKRDVECVLRAVEVVRGEHSWVMRPRFR